MRASIFSRLLLIALGLCGPVATAAERPYVVETDVRIPMRDGVTLAATVYRPLRQAKPLPVILTVTPYIADRFHDVGTYFASNEYVFASVDSRGRGNSGGTFVPWFGEGRDAYDAVEWLAKRRYCDGQVAMWGGSYSGKNQWLVAGLAPASLKTIVPAAAGYVGYDMGMRRNVPFPYMLRWLTLISGKTPNRALFEDTEYWNGLFHELSRGGIRYRDLDRLTGSRSAIWREWIAHPQVDSFWDAANPSDAQFAGIRIPVLSITGAYDDAQLGTLEFRRRHLQSAPASTRAPHYLIVGPWHHGGTRRPQQRVGGLDFGPDSVLDMRALHREWYDWTMKRGPPPRMLKDRFTYFIAGTNTWTTASDLASATARSETLWLASQNSRADRMSERGALSPAAPASESDSFRYDPAAPAHNEGVEGEGAVSDHYLADDRSFVRLAGDGLIYDSPAYAPSTTLTGSPKVVLHAALDVPDTDIRVQLFEILTGGQSVFLGHDYIRARYRNGSRQAQFARPGNVEAYVFDQFPFIARTIAPGSRIRLVVSPLGASIHQQRNRNSGGVVADETARDNRVANIRVSLGHGLSHVILPFGVGARQ